RKRRQIEVTSYAEVVLKNGIAEMLHPTFSNLFVQTEILKEQQAIMCTRRPRSENEHPPYMFHLMKVHGAETQKISFETNRDQFIGRGNTIADPDAMYEEDGLSGSQGSVLDPIVAIQYKLILKPYESITLDLVYGIGNTQEECQHLVNKYQDKHLADRAFELAWTHSHVMLRQINATAADAILYCRLAGSIIYSNASLRADPSIIMKNHRGQSGLWSHSVSGDWPIVLVQIEDNANIDLVQKLVQAHAFWRLKGLKVDLVIWNEDHGGYRQVLHNQILSMIAPTHTNDIQDKPGGIYIRTSEQLSNEDRLLFQTVARVFISDKLGTLEGQLSRRKRLKPVIPNFSPAKSLISYTGVLPSHTNLKFFNGLGGFSNDGKEYVITTSPDHTTPAPWSNVIANQNFGTVISESGQSYTWFQNAHELRLTPWNNDPVTDMGGEHFYIRDEETGKYWSPAPLPTRGRTPYHTRHGFGYSVFEHMEEGIQSELIVFIDPVHPIKYSVLRLKNVSGSSRTLSATGYIEWVLGDLRHKTLMHIVTELDLNSGAIIARNSYQTEFGQLVAFFDVNHATRTMTTDRDEFIGRNGSIVAPDAMRKTKLSGKTGAALDPCAVIQIPVTLQEGEEIEIIFRMGTGMHMNDVNFLIRQSRGRTATIEALTAVNSYWKKTLSAIQIDTPDAGINLLTNGWLTYQTLACRLWARSGYYQSGGAFGFRDQLQDVMSLLYAEPALARQQIVLCASRQFVEGDVQHWWHPPVGRGVRTKCSDDYLWLPYVTSKYVMITGDITVLDEQIQFLESRELNKDEDSYYDLPIRSDQVASLYEHCIRALEFGCKFGVHGLPLMGSGDWNDGMDRVGEQGKGESVWLGWFLYDTLQRWIEIAEIKNEDVDIVRYRQVSIDLRKNIEEHAWDGLWYRRAYFDDGTPLGSKSNDECKIDSIAQSWSVISKAGDHARTEEALKQADTYLIDAGNKIIKLFDPPFDKSSLNPGYIKGYVPGVRENGGQYTHAAIWMIMAFAAKRDKAKMWQLLQMINPIRHAQSPEGVQKYKVEPYVIAADVYAIPNQMGRGGWTWYTGSAGWVYQLIIEYVFGLKRRGNTLTFEPCLPEEWRTVKLIYRYINTSYVFDLIQTNHEKEEVIFFEDEQLIDSNEIQLVDDGNQHNVEVRIHTSLVN
ncbi:MAG: cyclic beta 1-2 glucan synthetase, partial [Bacteroidota bacterium]|nr:cyclic beta 1-2 glucan synthetase [Bacteroidota bacterium]